MTKPKTKDKWDLLMKEFEPGYIKDKGEVRELLAKGNTWHRHFMFTLGYQITDSDVDKIILAKEMDRLTEVYKAEGYAQALVDEINFLETLHPEFYTSCKCGCFNGERTTCIIHQIKQRIQALKNHSPENPNTTREGVKSGGVSRINPTLLPENALNHSQDSPSGDLCQNCGHERFLHFINQRKGKCGYSENNVTHDCDCKQFKPMKLCVNCKIRDKCEGLEYIDSTQCAYFTPKEQK